MRKWKQKSRQIGHSLVLRTFHKRYNYYRYIHSSLATKKNKVDKIGPKCPFLPETAYNDNIMYTTHAHVLTILLCISSFVELREKKTFYEFKCRYKISSQRSKVIGNYFIFAKYSTFGFAKHLSKEGVILPFPVFLIEFLYFQIKKRVIEIISQSRPIQPEKPHLWD
jgi:hypothetical protein